jgi:uncharacterized protein (PEP-CTERM system associated)
MKRYQPSNQTKLLVWYLTKRSRSGLVANTAMVDTAMDLKYKLLPFATLVIASLVQAQPAGVSPGGTADKAIEGVDLTQKRPLTLLPGVRSSLSYSDNLSLRPEGNRTAGFRLETSPYVFASINNDQGVGQAYLSLRNFYQSSAPSGFYTGRIDLRGNGTLNLYDKWLFLEGSGFAYTVSPLNFSPIAFDAASLPTATTRFQGFSVAPYIAGNWGTFADYKGQYSYGTSEVVGFSSRRTSERLSGSLKSGSGYNTWGWALQGETSQQKFANSSTAVGRNISTATLYSIPLPSLRIGGALRYEQIDGLFNKKGLDNGIGPGLSVDWTPSNRTSLQSAIYKQYYGNIGNVGFSHRWERLGFNLSYDKSVITGNDASFLNINPNSLFGAGGYDAKLNPIYRSLVGDTLYGSYGVPIGLGVVSDAYVLRNGGSIGLSYLLSSGFISITASDVTRDTLIRTFDPILGGLSVAGSAVTASGSFVGVVKTKALALDWEYKLDSRSKWRTQFTYSDNIFPSILRTTTRTSYQATYSTRVTPETTASFGLRRVEQKGTGYQSSNYDENTVFSTIDVRF